MKPALPFAFLSFSFQPIVGKLVAASALLALLVALVAAPAGAAERLTLRVENYERAVPVGKEVDAIFGDSVLRNDRIVAVVAAPGERRDANLTVHNVGGAVIDLTEVDRPNDQLSCFYPGGGTYRFDTTIDWPADWEPPAENAAAIAFSGQTISLGADAGPGPVTIRVGYELRDGEPKLRVVSTLTNTGDKPVDLPLRDGVRADGDFVFDTVDGIDLWRAHDVYWRQAYGVQSDDPARTIGVPAGNPYRKPRPITYPPRDAGDTDADQLANVTLGPGESVTWRRSLFPAGDGLGVQEIARRNRGEELAAARLTLTDGNAPVAGARVEVVADSAAEKKVYGVGVTDRDGRLSAEVPAGDYTLNLSANAHETMSLQLSIQATPKPIVGDITIRMSAPAYVEATITDAHGEPLPAKVQFIGTRGTASPDWGPESAVRGVLNLQHTPDGRFRAKLAPGSYRWLASYGPEHDAAEGEFTVAAGETAAVAASLERTVDTAGWLSAELHSHSSPSGDNTASQRGRVLNLLTEHLEFCPCTEHQRIDVYDAHLEHFSAAHRVLTCPGMELTGQPLPLNHQNAFPLVHRPHEQHGGAPATDLDPVAQIERLAAWDDHSEKLVQSNHPNIAQMVGDRDLNGEPDTGFEKMFGSMDVIEVHPPELIFEPLGSAGDPESGVGNGGWEGRGNVIVNWLQLLNLGYRVPGVVNTDAHYNHHGSGWLRNWVRSSTDDPAEASVAELVREFELGHVVMSNGPYLEVEAVGTGDATAIPGDDFAAPDGVVRFHVVVRCPNWLDVNRVQLFLNGRPATEHNYTARSHADWFSAGPGVFDQEIEVRLDRDTHVVVAVCGEGRQLGAIYGEKFGAVMPVAVANPIFVDVDGDADHNGHAFEPNGDGLGLPLPTLDGLKPSHGHDHTNHSH